MAEFQHAKNVTIKAWKACGADRMHHQGIAEIIVEYYSIHPSALLHVQRLLNTLYDAKIKPSDTPTKYFYEILNKNSGESLLFEIKKRFAKNL